MVERSLARPVVTGHGVDSRCSPHILDCMNIYPVSVFGTWRSNKRHGLILLIMRLVVRV